MPTPTAPKPPRLQLAERRLIARVLAAAAGFALIEILLGVFVSPFWSSGRAEALPLIPFRPWLLIGLAAALAARPWKLRLATYAAALLAAALGESFYLIRLGNPNPWVEMLRILGGSVLVLAVADAALRPARIRMSRMARWAIAAALAALLFVPGVLKPYRAVLASAPDTVAAGAKPELVLMTALPIIWGEGDVFSLNSRPAGVYTALQEEFTVRPVDTLDRQTLGKSKLLLLAQPRWLSPGELVAVDAWVREGGRALVLADPKLDWDSELPLGDVRRPPPVTLLKPLLDHWGLALEEGGRSGADIIRRNRRLAMHEPGQLRATRSACRAVRSYFARCSLGRGQAIVLADADLMRDELWMSTAPDGGARDRRLADNPLVLADLLDALAGVERERVAAPVIWRQPGERPLRGLLPVLVPLLLLAFGAAALLLRGPRTR